MKKVIIGIHGLGNKPSKRVLTNYWKKSMQEGLSKVDEGLVLPDFRMVYWADVFNDAFLSRRKRLPDDPYYLDEPYVRSMPGMVSDDQTLRQKVLDYLNVQLNQVFLNEDLTLNYSFLTDLILKKYFIELSAYFHETCYDENKIECMAKDLIRRRAVRMLRKYEGYSIMLVGHSMGSIVAFDVLSFLVPEIQINTLVTIGSPLGLPIVISKIAAEQKVRSNKEAIMKTPPGVVRHWFNYSDLTDKIAFNYKLSDDFRSNAHRVGPKDELVVNDYMIEGERNPHKSFGYLRTPAFAKMLRDFIMS
ncbi:MAG: hypothetical protein JXQ90_23105 [Cyclobacteriaceae bacterium]